MLLDLFMNQTFKARSLPGGVIVSLIPAGYPDRCGVLDIGIQFGIVGSFPCRNDQCLHGGQCSLLVDKAVIRGISAYANDHKIAQFAGAALIDFLDHPRESLLDISSAAHQHGCSRR